MARRVLVTGASGFIGRNVARALAALGVEVVGVARRDPALSALSQWIEADILATDMIGVFEASKVDAIIHCAWETRHGYFWSAAENLDWVGATNRLLRAASVAGVRRFVGVGTWAEYEWSGEVGVLSEGISPLVPASLYGVAKDASRRVAQMYCSTNGISFAWGRVAMLYGANEPEHRFVSSLSRALLCGRAAEMSSGLAERDFLDVRDAGAALAALAVSEVEGAVNIGSGVPISLAAIGSKLASLVGRPDLLRLGARADVSNEPRVLSLDVTRLREEIGFSPKYDLERGLMDALAFWNGKLVE